MKFSASKVTKFAVLISVALVLSVLEAQLPSSLVPLPGVKLGFSNIVTLFTLYTLGPLAAATVLFCRCILASLFGGGITSLMFSLFGGFSAILIMSVLKKSRIFSVYGVSIGGAAAHSFGQIIASMIMLDSLSVIYYLPLLLLSSVITGSIIAFISALLLPKLNKYV